MTSDIAYTMGTGLSVFMTMALPPLAAAMLAGLLIAVFQAATQIQDQTLPQAVKLFVVIGTFAALSGALFGPLTEYAQRVYMDFPSLVR
ncbi:MAG: flagellar biosynthetic protein FliQ [Pseudomonadota bacterium]